ncbi:MAG: NADH dehydrogenase [Parcubacteria group bacterium Gr01-1014_70]|nr:MAG: NADH dehydrogenase [Parcubacteria group bacterium Gr01-1014_70]
MIPDKKHIIIVGAGFGGITAMKRLVKKLPSDFSVILVDRHHHQLYTPALYEIASVPREITQDGMLRSSILLPIKDMIQSKSVTHIVDEFIGLDPARKTIQLQNAGAMAYEYLILALGSETSYFDIPGLRGYGFPFKNFIDAIRMRNVIETSLKEEKELHIVVGGAGSAGVELVAEFVNFICIMQEKLMPDANKCSIFFTLIEAAPDILPGFEPWVIALAKKRLHKLGVTLKTGATIASVSETHITFGNGEMQKKDILIWTGGVKGPAIFHTMGLEISSKDSLIVDEYLRAKEPSGVIFAIGDNAMCMNPFTQKPVVGNVPAAEQEAKTVAMNVVRAIAGKPLIPFKHRKKYPFVLAVGKKYAIADLVIVRCWGLGGWIAKQLIELRYALIVLPFKKAILFWWRSVFVSRAND